MYNCVKNKYIKGLNISYSYCKLKIKNINFLKFEPKRIKPKKIRKCKITKKKKNNKSIGYFNELTKKSLLNAYYEKFQYSKTRGIDGKRGVDLKVEPPYASNKTNDLYWLISQVKKNIYKFNVYQEIIVSKGKGKNPRIISKATVRDSIVLYTLKEYFKKNVKGSISIKANDIIQNIIEQIKNIDDINDYIFFQTDIENYYGSINQKILLEKIKAIVKNDLNSELIINLINKIIKNPTMEFGVKKDETILENCEGVPQGLSLSNVLANLYLRDFDTKMKMFENDETSGILGYYRYVDDILIICKKSKIDEIETLMKNDIEALSLKTHNDKTVKKDLSEENSFVDFLGYIFRYKKGYVSNHLKLNNFIIKPRKKTSNNFLKSILSQFTLFKKNLYEITNLKNRNITDKRRNLLKANFVFRLNLLIAGCIANGTRFGFFSYFSKISTPYLAHQAQNIIKKELIKLNKLKFISEEEYKELLISIKKPITSFYSTQNEQFFQNQTTINFDDYMDYQEYVNLIGKKSNQTIEDYYSYLSKKSPEEFVKKYDKEHYEHLDDEYEGKKFRYKIYYYFNKLKKKNLDILSKDIKGSTGSSEL